MLQDLLSESLRHGLAARRLLHPKGLQTRAFRISHLPDLCRHGLSPCRLAKNSSSFMLFHAL